jgi:hypothetical protein
MRTVKSRGPDTPTLVSALMRKHHALRWPKSPVHRGEREAAVKPSARGMPDVSAEPVVPAACIFLLQAGHGCGQRPAFPVPSVDREGANDQHYSGSVMPREGGRMSLRHCELGPATKSRPAWDESGSIYLTLIEGNRPTFFLGAKRRSNPDCHRRENLDCFRLRSSSFGGQVGLWRTSRFARNDDQCVAGARSATSSFETLDRLGLAKTRSARFARNDKEES